MIFYDALFTVYFHLNFHANCYKSFKQPFTELNMWHKHTEPYSAGHVGLTQM